jgi:PucR C-terminal helix-turn-helix domain/GGDEF-like domain
VLAPTQSLCRPSAHQRAAVVRRLEAQRLEIEEAVITRALAVSRPSGNGSAEYLAGLRAAIAAALEHGLAAIEHGIERAGAPPPDIPSQARRAARQRVALEVVLRRYAGGYSAIGDFLSRAAVECDLSAGEAYALQRELTAVFDQLVAAVGVEYRVEAERLTSSSSRRLAHRVRRLLAGELVDIGTFDYDLEGWHLGVVGSGAGLEAAARRAAAALDARLLVVEDDEDGTWAWLGAREALDPGRLEAIAAEVPAGEATIGIGEPGKGQRGWRRTHRQAYSALEIGCYGSRAISRYAEVGLLAALAREEDLLTHLSDAYLAPLASERDDGRILRETLRAYFQCERNVSSAAAVLGIARQTVASRLRVAERLIGRSLASAGAELEAILRWESLVGKD